MSELNCSLSNLHYNYERLIAPKDALSNASSSQLYRHPLLPAQHTVPRGRDGPIAPHVRVPLLTAADIGALPWSHETSIRQSSRGQILLHNYTVYTDQDGTMRTRWLKREFVSLSPDRSSSIDKRGFGVRLALANNGGDYAIPWPSKTPGCPRIHHSML